MTKQTQTRLDAGTRVGRYEIRSLLGRGAMGEVYLAHDTGLRRQVAIKLMLQTDNDERVHRFRQEARTASSLNHPNIMTVYDFGQFEQMHFIVTELITGQTLRQRISQNQPNCAEALEIAIQIGTGLRAAHEAGIIHRDIKPENVMILPDGHVKLLDFGLAKLRNPPELLAPSPQASTTSLISTDARLIVGTVNYMPPEQLRGQKVDERADIWSLGIVLYEMIASKRPFEGESVSDVIAAILERPLLALAPDLPEVPADLDTIMAKALSKDREQRYQSTQEFVERLKVARRQVDSPAKLLGEVKTDSNALLAAAQASMDQQELATKNSATSTDLSPGTVAPRLITLRRVGFLLLALPFLLALWFYLPKLLFRYSRPSAGPMRMTQLLTTGIDPRATISPDGRLFVYVEADENGKQSLRLGQVTAAGSKELIPAGPGNYRAMTFTPDGNWIYFLVFGLKKNTTSGTLFRITILGSAKQELIENVDSPITFASDGQHFAFLRALPEQGKDQLIIGNVDGQNLRVLSERSKPDFYLMNNREAPDWSTDGKLIATPAGSAGPAGQYMTVVAVDTQTGQEQPLTSQKWLRVGRTLWLKNGAGLVITSSDSGTDLYQIYRLSRPGGQASSILPDLRDYSDLSLSADGKLMAVATDESCSIFTTATENQALTSQIATGEMDGFWGLDWSPAGDVVYVSLQSRNRDIWIKDADSKSSPRQLTFDAAAEYYPTVSPDGRYIVFVSNRGGSPHLWRMDSNGINLKQLTNKTEESFPQITPDSQWIIYSSRTEGRPSLWKVSIDGGEPVRLTNQMAQWPALSPDGKWIACITKGDAIEEPMKLGIFSATDFSFRRTMEIPEGVVPPELSPVIRWPNERTIAYIATRNGISNIWAQPLYGGAPRRLTDFTADRIFWFGWSKNGNRLAFARGVLNKKVVLIEGL